MTFRIAAGLGTAQTIAWASTYYLPAVSATAMAEDLGVGTPLVFAGLSLALVVAAMVGPWSGALIDRHGGRRVLAASSLVFAGGLLALALASDVWGMLLAWTVLGLGMGAGLYEGAFATAVRLRGLDARSTITGIALIAGFASTVGWPASAWMIEVAGWRGACVGWAALHLAICLPIHLQLPPVSAAPAPTVPPAGPSTGAHSRRLILVVLAISFAVTWFTSTAMAAHLPRLLEGGGLSPAAALGCAMLVGPAQVAARIAEFTLLNRLHPLLAARLASAAHSLGGLVFLAVGAPAGAIFAVLHGAGNGILTIAKGTLPLALLGADGYGARQGWLMAPARLGQAAAPLAMGMAIESCGVAALWLTIALGAIGTVALLLISAPPRR
jgi:predicted MFS family arabinose efflux permease